MSHLLRRDALVVALLLVSPASAWAQWTENGVPVANAPGHQTSAAIVPDGQGGVFVAWLDTNGPASVHLQRIGTDGRPRGRYGYRLEFQANGSTFAGEVWVDVPVSDLRLVCLSPNPATRGWTVSLWLADGTPAMLEAIDVQGRLVMSRDVGVLGIGRHEVPPEGSDRLPAGVYTLRLTQAGRVATARGIIVR